jgi:acyl-CoA thioester hydrolase
METLLKDYPAHIKIPVQWGDMDAAQHVNNIIYLRWFETARIQYFDQIGELIDANGKDVMNLILAETYCRYRIPVTFPDNVIIAARVLPESIYEFGFKMEHIIISERNHYITTEGWTRIVWYDYDETRKAPLPERVKAKILALENNINTKTP